MSEELRFGFGKNWQDYVRNFADLEKIKTAQESLLRYLPVENYREKMFIDVGCGSGIFSLSALSLGCTKVVSFDVDQNSVQATTAVRQKFSNLAEQNLDWEIFRGSILDQDLVKKYKAAGDIVYSWGVLHHTGNMGQAIRNAAEMVKPGGSFIIAIYNRAPSSGFWVRFKRFYNQTNNLVRKFLNYAVYWYIILRRMIGWFKALLIGKPRPTIFVRERGMSIYYDVVDWLGGYPYEFATFDEIKQQVENLGFELISGPTRLPSEKRGWLSKFSFYATGCNEFVFKKKL